MKERGKENGTSKKKNKELVWGKPNPHRPETVWEQPHLYTSWIWGPPASHLPPPFFTSFSPVLSAGSSTIIPGESKLRLSEKIQYYSRAPSKNAETFCWILMKAMFWWFQLFPSQTAWWCRRYASYYHHTHMGSSRTMLHCLWVAQEWIPCMALPKHWWNCGSGSIGSCPPSCGSSFRWHSATCEPRWHMHSSPEWHIYGLAALRWSSSGRPASQSPIPWMSTRKLWKSRWNKGTISFFLTAHSNIVWYKTNIDPATFVPKERKICYISKIYEYI